MQTPPNYAAALVGFAERLYGDKWQGDLARALGVPKLRVARLAAAVRAGKDYAGAQALLAQLRFQLQAVTDEMGPWVRGVPIPR
jgi:hypothetical protein